jgi:hypothetical protein
MGTAFRLSKIAGFYSERLGGDTSRRKKKTPERVRGKPAREEEFDSRLERRPADPGGSPTGSTAPI